MRKDKPEIVLASYPRSGNTFFRNLLWEVYGWFSWNNLDKYTQALYRLERFKERNFLEDSESEKALKLKELEDRIHPAIVKTHELPVKILPYCKENVKIIYLIRDGRDALVSQAHHNVDIVNPGSKFSSSLKHSIIAPGDTHFGGWSQNVRLWREKADAIVYFEELIKNPLDTIESLRHILNLPSPNTDKIPTFESQKKGASFFGGAARKNIKKSEKRELVSLFFRNGKIGGWKNEMDLIDKVLYRFFHDKVAREMGYKWSGFNGEKWIDD